MSESIDNLGVKISQLVSEYVDDVQNDVLKQLDFTADEILKYIHTNCPRGDVGGNHLADSFIKTEVGSGLNKTIYISSSTKVYIQVSYNLIFLLGEVVLIHTTRATSSIQEAAQKKHACSGISVVSHSL